MLAIIFPGQGSQTRGMGKELYFCFPEVKAVFDQVSEAVSRDMAHLCFESDEETLRQTENAQLALYTTGLAAWSALKPKLGEDVSVVAMAGHSLGEYTALAAAGIITLEEGARLVKRRGDLMSRSGALRPGMMLAVLGLEFSVLMDLCKQISGYGEVSIANYNSLDQLVVSGDKAAVTELEKLAVQKGARKTVRLNVSGAFHSPLMEEPAFAMGIVLREISFNRSNVCVYSNVTGTKITQVDQWPDLLEKQLKSPVLWLQLIQNMALEGIDKVIECGHGEVLCGLVKRIDKSMIRMSVNDSSSLQKVLGELSGVCV